MEFRGHDNVVEVVAFAPIAAYASIRELAGIPVSYLNSPSDHVHLTNNLVLRILIGRSDTVHML